MPSFVFTWSVCTLLTRAHRTHTHTFTQTHTGLSKVVTRAEHCTRWCYYYASGLFYLSSSIFAFRLFFFCLSDRSNVTASRLQAHPPTPPYLYEGPKMFSKSSFLRVSVGCKKRGRVNVLGWVRVRVLCDIVKRLWESFGSASAGFQVGHPSALRERLAPCSALCDGPKCPPTIL